MGSIGRVTFAAIAVAAGLAIAATADAANLGDSSSYNTPWGMTSSAQTNQPIDPSLRDANSNLEVVNGQFRSSAFAQAYGMASASAGVGTGIGPNGTNTSGAAYGGATAIGNQLNVVTVGSGNTVIVNSNQTNNGNQTATTTVNGH